MLQEIRNQIFNYKLVRQFFSGNERTIVVKKNAISAIAQKFINLLSGFLIVRFTIGYLDESKYGLWLTISSIISWLSFLDIGLGNGLRNKLADALARKDTERAKIYVSTSYFFIASLVIFSILLIPMLDIVINWQSFLNAPKQLGNELRIVVPLMGIIFVLNLFIGLIGTILTADQKPAKQSAQFTISSLLTLFLVILLIIINKKGSLIWLGIISGFSILIVPLLASLWYFTHEYKSISPSLLYVRTEYLRELFVLGIKFLFIQIFSIAIFSTDNIIIARLLGHNKVTAYNLIYKYFDTVTMLFAILLRPFWSAFTTAYSLKDYTWIKNAIRKLMIAIIPMSGIVLIMILFAKPFIVLWIGKQIELPFVLIIMMGAFVLIQAWNRIFAWFLNGISDLNATLILTAIAAIVHVPLSIFFGKMWGLSGVFLGTIISIFIFSVALPLRSWIALKRIKNMSY